MLNITFMTQISIRTQSHPTSSVLTVIRTRNNEPLIVSSASFPYSPVPKATPSNHYPDQDLPHQLVVAILDGSDVIEDLDSGFKGPHSKAEGWNRFLKELHHGVYSKTRVVDMVLHLLRELSNSPVTRAVLLMAAQTKAV